MSVRPGGRYSLYFSRVNLPPGNIASALEGRCAQSEPPQSHLVPVEIDFFDSAAGTMRADCRGSALLCGRLNAAWCFQKAAPHLGEHQKVNEGFLGCRRRLDVGGAMAKSVRKAGHQPDRKNEIHQDESSGVREHSLAGSRPRFEGLTNRGTLDLYPSFKAKSRKWSF
jgi:hypothetical protein